MRTKIFGFNMNMTMCCTMEMQMVLFCAPHVT